MRDTAIAGAALAGEAILTAMGCTALRPLPRPSRPIPTAITRLDDFWNQIDRTPLQDCHDSAFTSTMRIVKGDLRRKLADQVPGLAGSGAVPQTLQAVEAAMPPGRAPLVAFFCPPQGARPWVLMAHGLYDSKLSRYLVLVAEWLVGEGLGVLIPDLRWHGSLLSREWLPTLGLEEARDLVAWGRWLQRTHGAERIGLLGFSLGGLDVIHAVSRPEAADVFSAGAIAISPPASLRHTAAALDSSASFWALGRNAVIHKFFRDALRTRTAAMGINDGSRGCFAAFLSWLIQQRGEGDARTVSGLLDRAEPGSALPTCKRPLLLIAAHDDPIYREPTAARLVEAAAGNPLVHVMATPRGGHIGILGTYPQWFANVLDAFFAGNAQLPRATN